MKARSNAPTNPPDRFWAAMVDPATFFQNLHHTLWLTAEAQEEVLKKNCGIDYRNPGPIE